MTTIKIRHELSPFWSARSAPWRSSVPLKMALVLWLALLAWPAAVSLAGEISEQSLREALVSYLKAHAPTGVEMEQWELRRGDSLPLRGKIIGIELPAGTRWRDRTPLRAEVETTSGQRRTLWINAVLQRARPVVVARRNLPMGHRIDQEDVTAEIRGGWRDHKDLYSQTSDVVGKKVWRPVAKGACIKTWHVRAHRNMQRGDAVVIVAESGGIRVQAPGRLLESGNPGDRVRVLNSASGKEVYATVVDSKTVTVPF